MKKLQNNFTTPEQSKRLLKLGVPDDSADCYYNICINTPYVFIPNMTFSKYKVENIIPCWSVGRLIEILCICYQTDMRFRGYCRGGMIESLISTYENFRYEIDFSELEE